MRRLLVALVAALGLVPATASAGLELGLQDDAYLSSADPRAWQLTRELRPDVIRYNVDWSSVARARPGPALHPGDPAYDWAATDGIVQNAARQGARVLLTIVQAPAWANGGAAPRTAPIDARDFGTFCRAVATRYSGSYVAGGRGGAAAAVTSYTVWNEPNRGQFLEPQGRHGLEAPGSWLVSCARAPARSRPWRPSAQVALGPLASRAARAASRRSHSWRATARPAARGRASSLSTPISAACCPPTGRTSARTTVRSRCATSTGSSTPSRRPTATPCRSG